MHAYISVPTQISQPYRAPVVRRPSCPRHPHARHSGTPFETYSPIRPNHVTTLLPQAPPRRPPRAAPPPTCSRCWPSCATCRTAPTPARGRLPYSARWRAAARRDGGGSCGCCGTPWSGGCGGACVLAAGACVSDTMTACLDRRHCLLCRCCGTPGYVGYGAHVYKRPAYAEKTAFGWRIMWFCPF